MFINKLISGRSGKSPWTMLLGLVVALVVLSANVFAQDYEFSTKLRRMGDKIGVEIWVKALNTSAAKLGSMTIPVNHIADYLSPAPLTYNAFKTDSVDYDANQTPNLPYRDINSTFHNSNGYNAILAANGSGYSRLEITFVGDPTNEGIMPITTGRGSFVGMLQFDINQHATLTTAMLTGISFRTAGLPSVSIADVNGNAINSSNLSFRNATDMPIVGVTILNPNGPLEAVNRGETYLSLGAIAGYPVYFERSGLVNTGAPDNFVYGTNALAYAFDYSLDDGATWTSNVMRFVETVDEVTVANYANYASGEIQTKTGSIPGYSITKGNGQPLTASGDGYDGVLRVIWKADQYFPYRSEKARVRIVQLATTGTTAAIDNRARTTNSGMSQNSFVLSRLFFVQLNGVNQYLKTSSPYSNASQLTVEAWVNLNKGDYAVGSEPAIVASSNGIGSPEEGAWMLYLKDGKYPAFRARELLSRGQNASDPTDIYLANLASPYALNFVNSDFSLGSSDAPSEAHRSNWVHIAATVYNDSVRLYVNGQIVAESSNKNIVDARMSTFSHPVWVGVNPNKVADMNSAQYLKAGLKEVQIWRQRLNPQQILERASGVYDANGTLTALDGSGLTSDVRPQLEMYYKFQGNRKDAADHEYQNFADAVDYYSAGLVSNLSMTYRPDRAHIKFVAPTGGDGVSNLLNNNYSVSWIGYGLGTTAPSTKDIKIEYSRDGGLNWAEALDNNVVPAGLPLDQVEIESGNATWNPYNSITETGAYHDLQGVGGDPNMNYDKQVVLRISGQSDKNQDNIFDISSPFYVAPHFAMQLAGNSYLSVPGSTEMNMSNGVTFVEAWINPYRFPRPTVNPGEDFFSIVSKYHVANGAGDVSKGHYALKLLPTGQLQFDITDVNGVVHTAKSDINNPIKESSTFASDSIWSHVAVLANIAEGSTNATVRFWIDGVPQYADSIVNQYNTTIEIDRTNTYPVYFGYEPGAAKFIGEMKEIRFWNGYPAGQRIDGIESKTNPTSLTKFIQGSQAVRATDLSTAPVNYRENLVAAFTFDGGSLVNNDIYKSINSTNTDLVAYVNGNIGIASLGSSFVPTRPYLKLVEPVLKQIVPNNETALRVRWVGFDYDDDAFRSGSSALNQNADLESSTLGGGGSEPLHYEAVASSKYAAGYVNALDVPATDLYKFAGLTSGYVQYALGMNVSQADPDMNNDKIYNDQGAISASMTNGRLRLQGRSTINSESPWEYTNFPTLRTESPLFIITPPSNFTVRVLLEGFHEGSDAAITELGDNYQNLGLKINLFNQVGGQPGTLAATANSENGYENGAASAVNAGAAPIRGTNGSRFGNVPFIFTELQNGNYFVVVEHRNHLPIMSRTAAPFKFNGDSLDTWTVESGWDFQSWGQNGTPSDNETLNAPTDNIYGGNGLFTAFGENKRNRNDIGYDVTGLMFNKGRQTAASNRMASLVAGDVYRDGKIDNLDRIKVRNDIGSDTHGADVTGDGSINGLDRDITDRNSNKVSSLRDLTVVTYNASGDAVQTPMFPWMSKDNPLDVISNEDPIQSVQFNNAARAFVANGEVTSAKAVKGTSIQGAIAYKVYAEPRLENNVMNVTLYIENTSTDWAPGNCTFGINYDANLLQFNNLIDANNIFSNDTNKGYSRSYSAPKTSTPSPIANLRTVEIDYDGFVRKSGTNVPNVRTKLGTLSFNATNTDASFYKFGWDKMTVVLTTDGTDVTGNGEFVTISPINLERSIAIETPNGGELLRAGKSYPITWTKPAVNAPVYAEYSTDNAGNWNRINPTSINLTAQSFNWFTPRISSSECIVRLVNATTGVEIDKSNGTFSISMAPVEITRPSSKDVIYRGGTSDFIRWNSDETANVRFEFSPNGLDSWETVSPSVASKSKESAWTLPSVNTKSAVVRMVSTETGEVLAVSSPFKILTGSVTITSPRGGDVLKPGESKAIRWNSDNVSSFYLQFSPDNGTTWEPLAADVNALKGSYPWVAANINTDNALIRSIWNNDPEMEYNRTGIFKIQGAISVEDLANLGFTFDRPVPNPFTTEATFKFTLPSETRVSITLYSAAGMKMANLVNDESYNAGTHTFTFNGQDLSSGLYIIHINAGTFNMTREIVHIK